MSLTIDASFYQTAHAIIAKLGVASTATNINLFAAWSYCEKPHYAGSSWQWNNPLNTTEPGFGATASVNSAGVKQYPTQADGIAATVATLTNGYYPNLVTAIKSSDAALFFAQTSEMATWGTNLGCIHSIYSALGTPPSQYLSSTATHHSTSAALSTGSHASPSFWGGVAIFAGIGIAVGWGESVHHRAQRAGTP